MRSTLRIQHAVTMVSFRQRRLLAALVLAIATSGNAQPATVSGTVTDAAGTRIPGANIQLARASAPSIQIKTDGKGHFEITADPGEYVLQTAANGFVTDKLPIHLSATPPTTSRVVLQVGSGGTCDVFIGPPVETLNASLSATLPLTSIPPYKRASRKPRSIGK
jgi:hypothetical protein